MSSSSPSTFSRFMSRRLRIATGLVCATAAAVGLSAGGAVAAADAEQPVFQMPFRCGETWQGGSRSDHSPTPYAIDWTHGGTTYGAPVVASEGGRATVVDLGGTSYGKYVRIDHTNGYQTLYAHLSSFSVSDGAYVERGEQIGAVGSTGNSTGAHLHYEQRLNGSDVATVFDGATFSGSGDWSKSLTSKNCEAPEPVDVGMTDLASADLNGDTVMDVVAVEVSTGKLWLYKGTTSGSIATGGSRVEIGSGGWNGMSNLVGGDFDGDGKDDIVGVEESSGKLWLYKGANNSTLTGGGSRVEIGSGGWNGMADLTELNLNQDGFADLAGVEKSTGKLYLYPGKAGGGLGARVEIGSGGWNGMSNLTGMDFDNDQDQDLVAVEKSTGKLFVYPATTPGDLGARVEIGSGGWNGMSDLIGGGLVNDNATDDLVGVEDATGKLYVYPGTGTALGARKEIGTGGW